MLPKESETIEYKSIVIDDIKKSVIAFTNSGGGTLYVGVEDGGGIVGLSDVDAEMLTINNMLRDGIKPDVTLFARCHAEQIDGRDIIL